MEFRVLQNNWSNVIIAFVRAPVVGHNRRRLIDYRNGFCSPYGAVTVFFLASSFCRSTNLSIEIVR